MLLFRARSPLGRVMLISRVKLADQQIFSPKRFPSSNLANQQGSLETLRLYLLSSTTVLVGPAQIALGPLKEEPTDTTSSLSSAEGLISSSRRISVAASLVAPWQKT